MKLVRSSDSKVLGLVYDGNCMLDRREYDSWTEFLRDAASIMFGRIPTDEESEEACKLIQQDEKDPYFN